MIELLIVDDEKEVVDFLTKYFGDRAELYATYGACNINDAWEILITKKPRLVLLDLKMPKYGGIGFLQRMKKENITFADVIVVTAFDEKDIVDEALSLGAKGYIIKPFTLLNLEKDIMELVPWLYGKWRKKRTAGRVDSGVKKGYNNLREFVQWTI